jgi:hypothetical protein
LNIAGYEDAFQRYERRQLEHRRLQDEIRDFLARFTGEARLEEAPFVLRDLARMEGLRLQRDDAYQAFHAAEQEIFSRLENPWTTLVAESSQD